MIETLRSVVSAKECDSNGHLNVAGYVANFSSAGQNFFTANGLPDKPYYPLDRHFRFHHELYENTAIFVTSIVVGRGSHADHLLHVLWDANQNRISATCLDTPFCSAMKNLPKSNAGTPVNALPNNIADAGFKPVDTEPLLAKRLALRGYQGRLSNESSDRSKLVNQSALIDKFFKSANHLWAYAGLEQNWLKENNYGAAAVEMKLTIHKKIKVNQDIEIISWVPVMDSKTLRLSHQMVSVPQGKPLASISAIALVMNLENRTVATIPQKVKSRYDARFLPLGQLVTY